MNDKTGEIRRLTPEEVADLNRLDAIDKGVWIPLNEDEALKLMGMNRSQRRQWIRHSRQRRQDSGL